MWTLILEVIAAIYSCTKLVLKSAIIFASQGVRQGAATSVFFFIIYIDRMVKMLTLHKILHIPQKEP